MPWANFDMSLSSLKKKIGVSWLREKQKEAGFAKEMKPSRPRF
jgi:hypothetical protein